MPSEDFGEIRERIARLETAMNDVRQDIKTILENHLPHLSKIMEQTNERHSITPWMAVMFAALLSFTVGLATYLITT